MKFKELESLNNPLVKEFLWIKNNKDTPFFLIDKLNTIEEIIKLNIINTIITVDKKFIEKNYNEKIKYILTNKQVLDKLSYVENSKGTVAIVDKREFFRLFDNNFKNRNILFIDDVQDPGNAGSIIRTACAFNFDKVYFSSKSADLFNDKLIRSTQGAIFKIATQRVNSISDIKELSNFEVIALENKDNSVNIDNFKINLTKGLLLVIGNEGYGLNDKTKKFVNVSIKVPIDNLESINVAAASAIAMYKLRS